jgi:nicotinamidase-related amidase
VTRTVTAPRTIPIGLDEVLEPRSTALIVWDMQVGMGGHAFNVETVVPRIQELLTAARRSGVAVLWSRHVMPPVDVAPAPVLRDFMRRQGVADPNELRPFMAAGSSDVELLPGLDPADGELVFEKSTRSAFVGTTVEGALRDLGIRSIVLAGVQTDQGIEVTARHAFALGFFPVVATDAVGSRTHEAHELGLTFLRAAQTDLADVAAITAIWELPGAAD